MAEIDVRVEPDGRGWAAEVRVRDRSETRHRVRVSPEELARYGAELGPSGPRRTSDEVAELVRRSFEFLLEHEPNTSILAAFDLSVIERYFPEYREAIRRAAR